MPLDPNIYQQMQPNLAGQLAGAVNQFTEQRARLSDLAQQREFQQSQMARQNQLQDYQIRGLQRAEEAIPAQQAEVKRQQAMKHKQELNLGVSTMLRQGANPEQVIQWGVQESQARGIDPELTKNHLMQVLSAGKTPEELANVFEEAAYPQEVAKQRFEQRFAAQKQRAPSDLSTLITEQESATGRKLTASEINELYKSAIQLKTTKPDKTLVQVQLPTGETVYQPRATAAGMAVPQKAGKGGAPEDVSAAKEQASLSSQQVLDQAEKLFQHPGRTAGTGASSWMGNIPGTEAKGFQANLETFKSQTFLPMVSALKGMGALSDAEGKKITASVGALDPQMPEKEFEESIKDTTRFLFNKAKAAGLDVQLPSFMNPKALKSAQGAQTYEGDKEARYQAWKAKQGK